MSRWRAFLIPGRVSDLPTVWSNCLAGWWLGGAGNVGRLPLLLGGTSLLYVGGLFLEEVFDREFDRQTHPDAKADAGAGSLAASWRRAIGCLVAGSLCLVWLGSETGALGLALLVSALAWSATAKRLACAPVFAGIFRFFVYVVAASTAVMGVTGWSLWCGLALAAYVAGAGFLARQEGVPGPVSFWPLAFLVPPILLALLMNVNGYREPALLLCAILALWVLRSLRPALWSRERDVRLTTAHLVAGIVFVDLLAVAPAAHRVALLFLLLFVLTLFLQRITPAGGVRV